MYNPNFNSLLIALGYIEENGLVHDIKDAKNNAERLYLDQIQQFCVVPDAILFRRLYKNEIDDIPYKSIPSVGVFNIKDSFFNSELHKKLHAELWSAGNTEIYILLGETRIDIVNARKPAKRIDKEVTLDNDLLRLASSTIESFEAAKFSAHLFGSGSFWEQKDFQNKIDSNSNPYNFLLDYLMVTRQQLQNNKNIQLGPVTIDKLLITSILIKFLEDIKDENGKHTLKAIYKKYNLGTETFEEGLRHGKCLAILEDLSQIFNGKIFDTLSIDEKNQIEKTNLNPIADFLSANIDINTKQGFFWKQYSFKHLPAEVISAIYENFIQAEAKRKEEVRKDVVYTPLHLVNLMIDEAMPLEQAHLFENQSFRILDPSCGSGVFLVAAYKRLLQWWTINHWNKTKSIAYPDKETAKQILQNNIFGVDIEEVAALVSIFGLTTAFLDILSPKEIWNDLKFEDLRDKNIIGGQNFIEWAKRAKETNECFDLVIGNPPFNETEKGKITNEDVKELFGKTVPGNKLSLKFLEAALYFGQKVCMIIPSNVFLYRKDDPAHNFRRNIFTNNTVERIYDFTHLRRNLFHKSADTPVISLLINNKKSEFQSIEHIVVKREFYSEHKIRFEIDYYDKHQVKWEIAVDDKKHFVWKTNLLGGGRLFHLVYRLSLLETLEDFIKKTNKKWIYSIGYISNHKNKVKLPADYITGHQTITSNSFDEFGEYKTETEKSKGFVEIRNKELFVNPHVVFQLVVGKSKIPMTFIDDHICFNSSFVGISSPKDDKKNLYGIYDRIHKSKKTSDLYRAYILANSPKALVYHETSMVKEDIDILPYPIDDKYLETSDSEYIVISDLLNFYRHLGKDINFKKDGYILNKPIEKLDLSKFGLTFCSVLNETYAEN
ncbi:MAG: N-6 DNA methylase, partial [Saprospiraceae bacterium]